MSSIVTKIATLLLLSLFLFAAGCGGSESPEGGAMNEPTQGMGEPPTQGEERAAPQ